MFRYPKKPRPPVVIENDLAEVTGSTIVTIECITKHVCEAQFRQIAQDLARKNVRVAELEDENKSLRAIVNARLE